MDTDLTGSTEQVESKWVLVRDALSTHCQWGICLSWTEQIFRENCLKNIQSYYSFFFSFSGEEVYCGVQVLSLLLKKITIFGSGGSSLWCVGFFLVLASGGYSSLQCSGFSLQWLLVEAPGLQSAGSAADMHRLTCSSAHGIFWPGIEPVSPALTGGFFTIGPPAKCPMTIIGRSILSTERGERAGNLSESYHHPQIIAFADSLSAQADDWCSKFIPAPVGRMLLNMLLTGESSSWLLHPPPGRCLIGPWCQHSPSPIQLILFRLWS